MRKKHTVDPEELERLKKEVENYISTPIVTPDDYERLSKTIQGEGCGYVSATTLKRIWGYIKDAGEDYQPSAYSLRILCNFIGFKDMDEFSNSAFPIQSKEYTGNFVESRLLPVNAEVTLHWQPNRRCVLRHIAATLFEVIEVENSHLHKDDIVECGCFTQHAPLYFTRVFRKNATPTTYMAGSANGITFTVAAPSEDDSVDNSTDASDIT